MTVANKDVEIILHVDETLGESHRNDLTAVLKGKAGVRSAEFCPLHYHLMLVSYDRDNLTSQDILHQVTNQSVHAQLIGPI